ncbi:MAG TPA: peroxiredoxin [Candidatus Binataceae bacterium]|nr:peroxiredoxin [Candidatus Binataceae bacterium]
MLLALLFPKLARAELLKVGDTAPEFATDAVLGDQVTPVRLSDYHGRKVVLYFYPKDGTPGCTREACAFRDGYARFQQWGIVLLGCSVDSADSHRGFARKYQLPFPLLADPDKKIARAYGVANGIPILGLDRRVTYVIDENGTIVKVYPNVDPSLHAVEIIQDLGLYNTPPPPTPTATPTAVQPSAAAAPAAPPAADSGDDIE